LLERVSKTAALASILVVVALQIAVHPDGTPTIRALAALALITGWLAAHASRQTIHAFWIFVAPLAPAVLRALTGREGPILDLIWMAGLAGALLRSVSWSQWNFPASWRALLGGWALVLSLTWPVIVAREANFDPRLLRDAGTINSWALLSSTQVVGWTLHVALTQLLGLVWFDWVMSRLASAPDTTPRAMHALWLGTTVASVVALSQAAFDFAFLSTPTWAELRRATGTMLDANAYGVMAAIAGPIAFLVLMRSHLGLAALEHGGTSVVPRVSAPVVALATTVLLVNLAGMWVSGSRTALICAVGGVVGLAAALWKSGTRAARAALQVATIGGIAAIVVLLVATRATGPLTRLFERPAESSGIVDTLWNRGGYGTIAMRMLREFPLTGVGVGAYHVIAPDYWRVMVDRQLPFDNAQNWWRHVVAEFGVLGGAAVLLWSLVVVWLVIAGRAPPHEWPTAAALRGLIAGIGVCSLLGMPTQTPVVLMSFLLLVAWLGVLVGEQHVPVLLPYRRAPWITVTVLAIAGVTGDLVLARGPLSLSARAVRAHRDYVTGAYPPEGTPGSGQFRWTRGEARFILQERTPWVVMHVWVHHPDVSRNPVRITISTPCGVIVERTLTSTDPLSIGLVLPPDERIFDAVVRVSRTWRPSAFGQRDPRELGAGVTADFVPDRKRVLEEGSVYQVERCNRGNLL